LVTEEGPDALDIVRWHGCLLEFAFERIGKRLITQLITNPAELGGKCRWLTAMEMCLNAVKVRVRRSRDHVPDIREPPAMEFDGAQHLQTVLRSQMRRHGNRNAIERIFRELKRRTSSFSNCFSRVEPNTAESWIQAFARWHNSTN
jgi:transposase-like protein